MKKVGKSFVCYVAYTLADGKIQLVSSTRGADGRPFYTDNPWEAQRFNDRKECVGAIGLLKSRGIEAHPHAVAASLVDGVEW